MKIKLEGGPSRGTVMETAPNCVIVKYGRAPVVNYHKTNRTDDKGRVIFAPKENK